MIQRNRREFMAHVGRGMLVASVGATLASDMGLSPARAFDGEDRLSFGPREALVDLMQQTPIDRLLPLLVDKIHAGVELRELVASAALANARKFGGEDYIGFHTLMALAPAWNMSQERSGPSSALPVLKVLYRNTSRLQETGGTKDEVLHSLPALAGTAGGTPETALRDAVRAQDMQGAENTFATLSLGSAEDAFNALLLAVEDNTEVHRVVLPYRAFALLDLVGREQAHTMLRQSVRYCVTNEKHNSGEVRTVLARLFDQFKFEGRSIGTRDADDAWVDQFCNTLLGLNGEQAADAAANALAEGISPKSIMDGVSLAANQLVLRDLGRPEKYASTAKPVGSVHGDSIGVHACDAVNAWRNISQICNTRNTFASVILAAYEVARDAHATGWGLDFTKLEPRPTQADLESVTATKKCELLGELAEAIQSNNQARACAIVAQYGKNEHSESNIFSMLGKYAISEDGALHAEKFYNTVREEFHNGRTAFQWRQLVALARVTASEYGRPAPGYAEACKLLNV